jgi:hypothetical protein
MSSRTILYRALMFGAAILLYSAAGMLFAAFGAEMPRLAAGRPVHLADNTSSGAPQTGPAGLQDKQKISGWDASEVRDDDGNVLACMIQQNYTIGGRHKRSIATFLVVSRSKGLTMLLKDSALDLPGGPGAPVHATLKIGGKPFSGFSAQVEGDDEIAVFPDHGMALASALDHGVRAQFDALKFETLTFPVVSGVLPWLHDCAQRWGISFEPDVKG